MQLCPQTTRSFALDGTVVLRGVLNPAQVAQLMQSQQVRIYHDHLLLKEAATRQPAIRLGASTRRRNCLSHAGPACQQQRQSAAR